MHVVLVRDSRALLEEKVDVLRRASKMNTFGFCLQNAEQRYCTMRIQDARPAKK
jgi:hypothetical protein